MSFLLCLIYFGALSQQTLSQPTQAKQSGAKSAGSVSGGQIVWASEKLFEMERGTSEHVEVTSLPPLNISGLKLFTPYDGVGYSDPIVSNGVVYFSLNLGDAYLIALDAFTGAKKWTVKRDKGQFSRPVIVEDTLYVGADGGLFLALDLKTQREKWRQLRRDLSIVRSAPVFSGGLIFYGDSNGRIYALSADSGKVLWELPPGNKPWSLPIAGAGSLYISDKAYLYKLDGRTGVEKWKLALPKGAGTASLGSNLVCFVDVDGRIHTVDPATGQLLSDGKVHQTPTRVAVDEGTIYFTGYTVGNVFAVDALTREVKWKFSHTAQFRCTSPTVTNGSVYFGCSDGKFYAVDAASGKKRWISDRRKTPLSKPAISDGMVYFISDDGKVYAVSDR
jgi:eukaryotic-like serine/threonine-protein kinase